jgi:hypothetical protein
MAYIGKVPTAVPLTGADIQDGTIQTADIADGAVTAVKTTGVGGANTPFFSALKTSNQTINDTSETKITFDSVLTESSSGVFDLSNNKFTCVTAGKYCLVFKATFFDDNNNLKRADMHVYKNGSQYAQEVFYDDDGHIREQVTQLTFIDDVAQNDYYELYVYGDTTDNGTYVIGGGDHSASKQTIMQGFKLIT